MIHNKYNIWIIGKQPRSLENINLETLFVTKPYESSPPPQRLGQISGGPYVINNLKIISDSCNFFQIFVFFML